ncbi:MAG: hypothetical protein K8T26_19810 [Lentisphaerae bacterium]|nr:hypothetical protein [Lentisphaerota bacterium]
MHPKEVIDRIKNLNIPHRAKAELMFWYSRSRACVVAVLRFVERHRQFGEAVILGAIMAYLLSHIPWIGGFLALCALVTACAIGVAKELKEDLNRLFELAQ